MGKSRFLVAGFYWMYTTYRPMVLQKKKNKHTFTAALYRYYRRRETRSLTCVDKRRLRGCSHDTGMTFILELVHSISFFLCICLQSTETTVRSRTSHSGTSSFRFSFRMIPSIWYEISFWYHVNWKSPNRVVYGDWRMSIWCGAKTTRAITPWLSPSVLSCEGSANFTLERNSIRNESHSVII